MTGLHRIILFFKFREIQSFFLFLENRDNLWKSEKVGVDGIEENNNQRNFTWHTAQVILQKETPDCFCSPF